MNLLEKIDDNDSKVRILIPPKNPNLLHSYPFMGNQILKPAILSVLCRFSARFNVGFFKDKIVLPEGDVLHIKTEAQRRQAIKKLDKILK